LAEAYNASIPVVTLFSDLPTSWEHLRWRGTASQGLHQLDMVKPFVKWCGKVITQETLPDMVRHAFTQAVSGRPGPVALAIPEDVFKMEWTGPLPSLPKEIGFFPRFRPMPRDDDLNRAAKDLLEAKRPVIVTGGGAMLSGAEPEVKQLAELLRIPVLQTFSGRGSVADTHPLGIGLVGGLAPRLPSVCWNGPIPAF
jgi:acetolactate synthase-1/2/3 large subunit